MSDTRENKSDIKRLRKQIDDLDDDILRLLNRRMLLVQEIAALKHQTGKDPLDLDREQSIFRRLARENQGPLAWGAVKKIFGEILAASRDIQTYLTTGDQ
ncbi:MAG: chorismate mutase [Deltaproteobacteria bacterium]|jgi:chorismate mutase|nr:MAG: chorismate mutase [Deltaproteobacteria bacterium]